MSVIQADVGIAFCCKMDELDRITVITFVAAHEMRAEFVVAALIVACWERLRPD